MKYALLIYSSEDAGPQTEEEMMAEMPQWFGYTAELCLLYTSDAADE